MRDDEDAARALGVNGMRVKLTTATISGILVGGLGTDLRPVHSLYLA